MARGPPPSVPFIRREGRTFPNPFSMTLLSVRSNQLEIFDKKKIVSNDLDWKLFDRLKSSSNETQRRGNDYLAVLLSSRIDTRQNCHQPSVE